MELRSGEPTDRDAIADVALASLRESYTHFIDESTIEEAVERWYAEDRFGETFEDENELLVVAEDEGGVVGFAQGAILESDPVAAELHWLHVHPDAREQDLGAQLLGGMQDQADSLGAAVLRGLVLAENEEGVAFYEAYEFERVGSRDVEIAGEEFEELVYEIHLGDEIEEQVLETVTGPDGQELTVNYREGDRGLKGPFYPTYLSDDLNERYGFFCGNCRSIDNTMDTMGRIVCGNCDNSRKATRWDASYL